MQQVSIVASKTKVVGSQSTPITGASNAAPISITATGHGLETDDIVQNSGVLGNLAANGQWVIAKVDANTFTLNNSVGSGAYTSGGHAAHVGFATGGLDTSNVQFSPTPSALTAVVKMQSATVGAICRAILEDAADSAFVTGMPLWTTAFPGGVTPANDLRQEFHLRDAVDLRASGPGDYLRLKILWATPVVGASFQFSAWLEF